jgi:phenylacetate-coenzyme A ligase PaaK-like adenylate-forming protein
MHTESQYDEAWALQLFRLHAEHNPVYRRFLALLGVAPKRIDRPENIPCLPVEAFKHHRVMLPGLAAQATFRSSGTTESRPAEHQVASLPLYRWASRTAFGRALGPVESYEHLALLPGYRERGDSSLLFMVGDFMRTANGTEARFFRQDFEGLARCIEALRRKSSKPVLVWGVSWALIDFAEWAQRQGFRLHDTETLIETGGMKGRRREWIRTEVHAYLQTHLGAMRIASEYGMTELLSQAYALPEGCFRLPPWMRAYIREATDPMAHAPFGQTGGISLHDLANATSCPFLATQDLGRLHPDGSLEVLGRFDHSDARGCSLMMA